MKFPRINVSALALGPLSTPRLGTVVRVEDSGKLSDAGSAVGCYEASDR